jgi:hypothetical protein
MGHLHVDLFQMNSFWPRNTPLSITLYKKSPEFYFERETANKKKYNFIIENIELHLDALKVDPSLSEVLNKQLEVKPGQYSFEHLAFKKFDLGYGSSNVNVSSLWTGKLPRRFCLAMIPQSAYKGTYETDPLKFTMNGVSSISLQINAQEFMKINGKEKPFPLYYRLLQFLQVGSLSTISPQTYVYSFPVFCVDLNTLCQKNQSCITEISPSGTLSAEIEFDTPLTTSHLLVFFAYTNSDLFINHDRLIQLRQNIG